MEEDETLQRAANTIAQYAADGLIEDIGVETNLDIVEILQDQETVTVLNCNYLEEGQGALRLTIMDLWMQLIWREADARKTIGRIALEIREFYSDWYLLDEDFPVGTTRDDVDAELVATALEERPEYPVPVGSLATGRVRPEDVAVDDVPRHRRSGAGARRRLRRRTRRAEAAGVLGDDLGREAPEAAGRASGRSRPLGLQLQRHRHLQRCLGVEYPELRRERRCA